MTGRGGGGSRRVLLPPINFLFRLLQQHTPVQIWLYEQLGIRITGTIRVCRRSFAGRGAPSPAMHDADMHTP